MNWQIVVVISLIFNGGYMVVLKAFADKVPPRTHMIYFNIPYTLLGLVLGAIYLSSHPFVYSPILWASFAGGVLAALGSITYFKAIPLAPGSILQPLVGMCHPLIAIMCLVFLHEPVTAKVICGISSIAVAIYLFSS